MKKNFKSKVAVLLSAYNGEKFIVKQLDSILNQTYDNFIIFISVDRSSDKTITLIRSLGSEKIKILDTKEKIFGSSTQNFFYLIKNVELDQFDYVSFSDQDDIWKANKLKNAVSYLDRNSSFNGYSSNVISFDKNNKKKKIIKSQKQTKYDYIFEGGGPGHTYLVRSTVMLNLKKKLFEDKSNFQKIFKHHDWLVYAYTRHFFPKWHISKEFSVLYRQHTLNELGSRYSIESIIKRVKFVYSGYALNQSRELYNFLEINDLELKNILAKDKKSGLFMLINFYKLRRSFLDKFFVLIISLIKIIKIL